MRWLQVFVNRLQYSRRNSNIQQHDRTTRPVPVQHLCTDHTTSGTNHIANCSCPDLRKPHNQRAQKMKKTLDVYLDTSTLIYSIGGGAPTSCIVMSGLPSVIPILSKWFIVAENGLS